MGACAPSDSALNRVLNRHKPPFYSKIRAGSDWPDRDKIHPPIVPIGTKKVVETP